MNFLSAENLSKSIGERWLFKNASLGISKGEKIALIGQNGSGKTSLLDILAGIQAPDSGILSTRKEIRVGYLNQVPTFIEKLSVLDTLFVGDSPVIQAIKYYEAAMIDNDHDALGKAMEDMETYNAWDYEARAKQILSKMGIENVQQTVATLSGGQRKRLALARLLIESPDLIILDEPTNHLDLVTIEWLENHLSASSITLLLVTHDRYFMDAVCNEIMELTNGNLYRYKGNYAYFLEKRAEREASETAETEKARNLLRKELDWMRRQPKARSTKAQYRIDAFYDLKDKAAGKVEDKTLDLNLKTARMGNKVMEINDLSKNIQDKALVTNFSYTFRKKDRIGIVGKNGIGKSTFLNLITQTLPPDSGSVVTGETIKIGYYKQSDPTFGDEMRVIDVLKEIAEVVTLGTGETITASAFLTLFLFPPAMQYSYVYKLSGGEKRRLQLLQVLIQNPNFLILDEPTNDLDIATLNVLEDFLERFGGCLVLVSHDRYFMDKLVEHLFVFEGEGVIRDFPGNYTDYRQWIDQRDSSKQIEEKAKTQETVREQSTTIKRKLSFKEQREYENLEVEINGFEQQKNKLITQLSTGGSHQELTDWAKNIETLEQLLSLKTNRWLELADNM